MFIRYAEIGHQSRGYAHPFSLSGEPFLSIYYNIISVFRAIILVLPALMVRCRKAMVTLFWQPTLEKALDPDADAMLSTFSNPTLRSHCFDTSNPASRRPMVQNSFFRFFSADFLKKVLTAMADRKPTRTTITLTDAEVHALRNLREHFDTQSVSETIRRSIAQSSLLKRYSDEEGDLVVEREGKKFVIPSRR